MKRYSLDPERCQVWIEGSSTVHPIHATATGLEGWIEVDMGKSGLTAKAHAAGEVRIEVDKLRSGNALVDRETRRRVDAKKFPNIVGRLVTTTRTSETVLAATGEIDFRGETCPVEGELTLRPDGDGLVIEGEQRFDIRDWGLQPPKLGLLKVRPEVVVKVNLVATPD
jgi:polyisoprenoid-binding protein YceI